MVEIGGKFQLEKNEAFYEHLVALGIPKERAKQVDLLRPILEITLDEREVTFSTISGEVNSSSKLIFDEEVDETIALNLTIRSVATKEDNQIKIRSTGPRGEIGTRVFDFQEHDMVMVPLADTTIKKVEEFVLRLYKIGPEMKTADAARYSLFGKKKSAEAMPPTTDALHLHIIRAHYQTYISENAHIAKLEVIDRAQHKQGFGVEWGLRTLAKECRYRTPSVKMVQIAGKYQLVENVNFYDFLLKVGIPEEKAKKGNDSKNILEVSVDGKKVKLTTDTIDYATELVLGEEVDEKMPMGVTVKSTAKLDGNVLTIESKKEDGSHGGIRIYTFSDTGLEMKIIVHNDDVPDAKRIYKRL